jgi:hypothetical protein
MPLLSIMNKIRTVEIKDSVTHYDELVEKIVMYPQVGEIEVYLFRQFKNADDEVVRTENNVEVVKGKHELDEFDLKAVKFVKNKKGIGL